MRQLLTSIYQRHCAKVEESEGSGLERFGKDVFFCQVAILSVCWTERALERDYFMTGKLCDI